jgi:Tfp pilus assembly protein PilX
MKQIYLRDQRGAAMLLELVLVLAVLGLVGFAVYQASNHSQRASLTTTPAATSAEGLATAAAEAVVDDSTADSVLAAEAEASATEAAAADADAASLGGTADASF